MKYKRINVNYLAILIRNANNVVPLSLLLQFQGTPKEPLTMHYS